MKPTYLYLGVTFVIIALFSFAYIFSSLSDSADQRRNRTSVVVGKPREVSEKKSRYVQSITYNEPKKIAYFPYQVIEVSPLALDTAEIDRKEHPPFYERPGEGGYGGDGYKNYSNFVNLVFVNQEYEHVHTLLDKKALILEVRYPVDMFNANLPTVRESSATISSTGRITANDSIQQRKIRDTLIAQKAKTIADFPYILYSIVFEDTNDDGRLNEHDKSDLYISDIDGKNLKKIGKNIKVLRYRLWNQEKKFFIIYRDRDDKSKNPQEKYAFYDIVKDTFTPFTSTHDALKQVEKILTQ